MCNMPLNVKLDKSNSDGIKKVSVQHLPQYAGSPPLSVKSVRGLTVLILCLYDTIPSAIAIQRSSG